MRGSVPRDMLAHLFTASLCLTLGFVLGLQWRSDSRTLYRGIPERVAEPPIAVAAVATLVCAGDVDGLRAIDAPHAVLQLVLDGAISACRSWRVIGSYDGGYGRTGWIVAFEQANIGATPLTLVRGHDGKVWLR